MKGIAPAGLAGLAALAASPAWAAAATALAFGACDSGESTAPHPTDQLDFPVSVTADPSGEIVWVVSGNFDLRFRSSAVLAIDVATNTFLPDLAFEIGGFPGPLKLRANAAGRATSGYITSRAEDDLYMVTFPGDGVKPTSVECPGGEVSGGILSCPKSKAFKRATVETKDGSVEITIGADPYGLEIVPSPAPDLFGGDLLLTGAMGDGQLATFELDDAGTPTLVGGSSLFAGLFSLVRNPVSGRVYATSKSANLVSVLDVAPRFDAEKPNDVHTLEGLDPLNPWVSVAATVQVPEPSSTDHARAIAVSRDGTRLYLAYRSPDSLVVLDISDTASGGTRQRVTQKIPLDNDPTDLAVVANPSGTGDLVYVSCFKANRVEIVDPESGEIVGGVHTGIGPSGLALIDRPGVHRLYVSLFNDNAVGVIELDPASPYYHTEIAEIR
ncbi:MAG: hypothetical protein U1F43_14125 [Myxococcota bacterium]